MSIMRHGVIGARGRNTKLSKKLERPKPKKEEQIDVVIVKAEEEKSIDEVDISLEELTITTEVKLLEENIQLDDLVKEDNLVKSVEGEQDRETTEWLPPKRRKKDKKKWSTEVFAPKQPTQPFVPQEPQPVELIVELVPALKHLDD